MAETSTKASPKQKVTKPVVANAKPEDKKTANATNPAAIPAVASAKPAVKEPAGVKKPATTKAPDATPVVKTTVASKVMIVSDEQRYRMIAEAAYYHAERNHFKSDHLRDWIDAERDIAELLKGGK